MDGTSSKNYKPESDLTVSIAEVNRSKFTSS